MTAGLTGGIGSGKSTVAKLLETMGCVLYHSDDRAKELYGDDAVRTQVIDLLGPASYHSNGSPDRAYIASRIFPDAALLKRLNAIIHPAVKTDFEVFVASHPNQIVIKESAILFETGIYRELDANILVTASVETRINRVMQRSALSRQEVEHRMAAQWSDEQKTPLADYVIHNDDNQALIPQVLQLIAQLRTHAQA